MSASRLAVRLPAVLLLVSACARPPETQRPGGASTAPTPVEVADGRSVDGAADLGAWEADPAVAQAIAQARPAAEASGRAPLRVADAVDGSFTAGGAPQSAVLYADGVGSGCCPVGGIAIVEDGRLVQNVPVDGGYALRRLPDLDGDGRDELAVSFGATQMGTTLTRVAVGQVGRDGLETWGSTLVYQDDCGGGGDGPRARRLVATPGRIPVFSAERFDRTCDAGPWTPTEPMRPVRLGSPDADADPWAR